jgi:hypothetical protein
MMRPNSLMSLLCAAMVSLSLGCSERPVACLNADLRVGDSQKVRQIAAQIAKRRKMAFFDKSAIPEATISGDRNIHFQLVGGGLFGKITALVLGKPLSGIDISGSHTVGQKARICFYGKMDDPDLHSIVDEFARSLTGASINFDKVVRQQPEQK